MVLEMHGQTETYFKHLTSKHKLWKTMAAIEPNANHMMVYVMNMVR